MNLLFRVGVFDTLHRLNPGRLTVLNYHRIADPDSPQFDTFKPNVSATPAAFARQMDYVRSRFNVVTSNEVVAWLRGHHPLPPYALLITFDDGYHDNYSKAYPILKTRDLSATIFLATDQIGSSSPFFWDMVAYCFHHTNKDSAELQLIGVAYWNDTASREAVMLRWTDRLKDLSAKELWKTVNRLPELLDVAVPDDAFAGLTMNWRQVREMVAGGIEMGAHTMSHPRLTRLSVEQAEEELVGSKRRIETEIERPVVSFAYPFGLAADFSPETEAAVAQAGFDVAFTLMPGPVSLSKARRAPLAIERIFVSHKDSLPRFAAKVVGAQRLAERLRS